MFLLPNWMNEDGVTLVELPDSYGAATTSGGSA
jgi:hypothetical protein